MKDIHVHVTSRYPSDLEDASFREAARSLGVVISKKKNTDFFLALDWSEDLLGDRVFIQTPTERRALIVREPPEVLPEAYTTRVLNHFGFVAHLGRVSSPGDFFAWPQIISPISSPRSHPRTKAVAVASWRVSFFSGSLYNLRAKAFSKLDIVTYGRGWKSGFPVKSKEVAYQLSLAFRHSRAKRLGIAQITKVPREFMGPLKSKDSLRGKFKCMVVIENSREYVSEKLFDAFQLGCIPVYCGAPLNKLGIPDNIVVTASPEIASLQRGIERAMQMDYGEWISRANEWLMKRSTIEMHQSEYAWRKVLSKIRQNWDGSE